MPSYSTDKRNVTEGPEKTAASSGKLPSLKFSLWYEFSSRVERRQDTSELSQEAGHVGNVESECVEG